MGNMYTLVSYTHAIGFQLTLAVMSACSMLIYKAIIRI